MAEREAGIGRSAQHTVHVLPHAPFAIARVIAPALERVSEDADATQLLIVTPDADTAISIADASRISGGQTVVAITSASRGGRLLASRVVPAIAATPSVIVALVRSSALKLDAIRTVIIAWADELVEARESEPLEVVLGEVPKEASRVVITDRLSSEVDAFLERHFRRASRHGVAAEGAPSADLPIRYVSTTAAGRGAALRRLLDDLDPPSVVVLASDAEAADSARAAIAALGLENDAGVRVETTPIDEAVALVIFYDLPSDSSSIAKLTAAPPAQAVALVTPRQLPALRRLTSGPVEPIEISRAAVKARARDERLRSALRAELQSGFPAREVMALEPLLSEFDGLEIAAAALRLLERQRTDESARRAESERAAERRPERAAEPSVERSSERAPRSSERGARDSGPFKRVFLSIGERDGVRPGDLVGAITGESGITSDRIGKLEIRDGHTVAEIAASDADAVIEKMNGVSLKGRRIVARVDDRPAPRSREGGGREARSPRRSGPDARRGGFGDSPRGSRGGFGDRSRDRGPRGSGRDRDAGSDRRPRRDDDRPRRDDDRPRGRGGFRDRPDEGRVPRAAREREEWSDRADRVRNARRGRRDES